MEEGERESTGFLLRLYSEVYSYYFCICFLRILEGSSFLNINVFGKGIPELCVWLFMETKFKHSFLPIHARRLYGKHLKALLAFKKLEIIDSAISQQ